MYFPNICRACMAHEPGMVPILKPTTGTPIDVMIIAITSINPCDNDSLPSQICKYCLGMLEQCFAFRQQIIKCDIKLRQSQSQISSDCDFATSLTYCKTTEIDSIQRSSTLDTVNLCDSENDSEFDEEDENNIFHNELPISEDNNILRNVLLPKNKQVQSDDINIRNLQVVQDTENRNTENTLEIDKPLKNREFSNKSVKRKNKENMEMGSDEEDAICFNNEKEAKRPKVMSSVWNIDLSTNNESLNSNIQMNTFISNINNQFSSLTRAESVDKSAEIKVTEKILKNMPPINNKKTDLSTKTNRLHEEEQENRKCKKKINSCKLCDYIGTNIKRHLATHLIERPYICENCNGAYIRRNKFVNHMKVCNGTPANRCTACNSMFYWKSKFDRHLTTEIGSKECWKIQQSKVLTLAEYNDPDQLKTFYTSE